jgi:hypothetical protein
VSGTLLSDEDVFGPQLLGDEAVFAPADWRNQAIPEGYVLDPRTGSYTTREMMAANMQPDRAGALVDSGLQGMTYGWHDEMAGAAGGEFGREYARARMDAGRRDFPLTSLGGEVGGAILSAVGTRGAATRAGVGANFMRGAATLPGMVAQGAAAGGGLGALYGAGAAEPGERMKGAAISGALGAALGGAIPLAGEGIRRLVTGRAQDRAIRAAAKNAPSVDDLRTSANQAYARAEAKGANVTADSFTDFADNLRDHVVRQGLDRDVTPGAWAVVQRMNAFRKRDMSFRDIETLRKVMGNAAGSQNRSDQRIASQMIDALDDYVGNLVAGDLRSGTASGLSAEIKEARRLWAQMRKSEAIGGAIERAKDAASGFENGIRIEFRKMLRNPRLSRGLSDAERASIRQVVRGTPTGNVLKRLSRLSFGSGAQTNFLGASVGSGAAAAAGGALLGPAGAAIGAVATPLVGRAAGAGAERVTLGLANQARNIAARGQVALPAGPALNALAGPMMRGIPGSAPIINRLREQSR